MLTPLLLLLLLSLAPGQSGQLNLTNVRPTYGILGATRPDTKFLPGDSFVLCFDRDQPGQPGQLVDQKQSLDSGELLVGLSGAQLDSANQAVRLTFHSDFQGLTPYPIHESAVSLLNAPGTDLGLVLDRGRIDLANQKASGAAKVRVRVRQDTWNLTLATPGTRMALELYSLWPRGVPLHKQSGSKDVPTANLVFLVFKGNVEVEHNHYTLGLSAPPGPAIIEWDSVTGRDHHRLRRRRAECDRPERRAKP